MHRRFIALLVLVFLTDQTDHGLAQRWSHETRLCDATNSLVIVCDRIGYTKFMPWTVSGQFQCYASTNCTKYNSVCVDGACVEGSMMDMIMLELAQQLFFWLFMFIIGVFVCFRCSKWDGEVEKKSHTNND